MTDERSTRSLFQQMDRDHSGSLDFAEFSTEFVRTNPGVTMFDMRELFDGADLNHNGLLDYSEVRRDQYYGDQRLDDTALAPRRFCALTFGLNPRVVCTNDPSKPGTRRVLPRRAIPHCAVSANGQGP
jgi:hypothetical protein